MQTPPQPPAVPIAIRFDADGLVPVIVQDRLTGEVRMMAFANEEALVRTRETGRATFWSRSRRELWVKGQTSGNDVRVVRILVDCDADCLIYSSEPNGPSCHTGARSCFFRNLAPPEGERPASPSEPPPNRGTVEPQTLEVTSRAATGAQHAATGAQEVPPAEPQTLLQTLEATLEARKRSTGGRSYTKSLYEAGPARIGAKIREEAAELSLAIGGENDERVASEAADVLYHVLVGLRWRDVALETVLAELARRFGRSGLDEKAAR